MEIKLNRTRIGIQLDPRFRKMVFVAVSFFGNVAVVVLDFAHKVLDRVLAFSLYGIVRLLGHGLFKFEEWLYDYLKKSKYVPNDQFEQKFEREAVVWLAMGIAQAKRITLREIVERAVVPLHTARAVKDLASGDRLSLLKEHEEVMRDYVSNSEKKDKRSNIKS